MVPLKLLAAVGSAMKLGLRRVERSSFTFISLPVVWVRGVRGNGLQRGVAQSPG